MIVSASYKTDIPAFYSEWLMNRIRAGFCQAVNPYGRQVYTISLKAADVDGFVFWTRNIGPLLPHLTEIRERGFPFVVQYTINGYPRVLDAAVAPASRSVALAAELSDRFGPRTVVWRYDPIVFTGATPVAFHVETFGHLAESLRGIADEVVISFAQIYAKTRRNLDLCGVEWWDPPDDDKCALAIALTRAARLNGMQLTVCSQHHLVVDGAMDARCIDARRLGDVGGIHVSARVKGNRPGCACYESRDIGDYDTCPHGCVYCYAVRNRGIALERYRRHDPTSEFLFDVPA